MKTAKGYKGLLLDNCKNAKSKILKTRKLVAALNVIEPPTGKYFCCYVEYLGDGLGGYVTNKSYQPCYRPIFYEKLKLPQS